MRSIAVFLLVVGMLDTLAEAQAESVAETLGYCGATKKAWTETRADLQQELTENSKLADGMSARVLMLRNEAAQMRDFTTRDVLLINADLWQSQIDNMKARLARLQEKIDRCDARAKIAAAAADFKPNSKLRKQISK